LLVLRLPLPLPLPLLDPILLTLLQLTEWLAKQGTSCRIILHEKLTVAQQFKKSLHFMKPESSLPCSQKSATGLYREPDPHTFRINAQIFQVVFSLEFFQPKQFMHF
jgi:hypothetical protein